MKNGLLNILTVFSILVIIFASCGKNTNSHNNHNTVDEQTVSPNGGTYTFADGISLIIPDGAVNSDTAISIRKLEKSDISYVTNSGLTEWTTMAAFEGLPEGTTFAKPVTLILPVEAITDETIVPFHIKLNSNDNGFAFVPGIVNYKHGETSISIQINGFSDHGVVGINPEAEIDAILAAAGVSSGGVLSSEDENKIISTMDCWIRSAVNGSIADGMGYADIRKVIDEYLRWRLALDELSAVIANIDSLLGEQDANARELCSNAVGNVQNTAVSACACGNDMSNNYSTLLAVQSDIDRLGWNELNDFVMTQDNLTLACGSLEIDPSTTDVGIGESKLLSVKVKDATGAVSEMSGLSGLVWTNGDSSKVELTPGDMSASAKGLDEGSVLVSVSYQLAGANIPEGCGLISTDATVEVKDSTSPVPGNGGNLTYSLGSGTAIALNWTAATDDKTDQSLLQYKVLSANAFMLFLTDPAPKLDTVENAEANGTIVNDWTANITSVQVQPSAYNETYGVQYNTYYTVLIRDDKGNKSVYVQKVAPFIDQTYLPVDGIYENGFWTLGPGNIVSYNSEWTGSGSYSYDLENGILHTVTTGSGGYSIIYDWPMLFSVNNTGDWVYNAPLKATDMNSFSLSGTFERTVRCTANNSPVYISNSSNIYTFNSDGTGVLQGIVTGSSPSSSYEPFTWTDNNDNTILLNTEIFSDRSKCIWLYNGYSWFLYLCTMPTF